MKATSLLSAITLVAGTLSSGCSADVGPIEEVGQVEEAVIGVDTFVYFRSNATGWGVDDATRLLPFAGVWARRVDVLEPWMVSGGDTGIMTETNQLNGWGTSQVFSGPVPKSMVEPPTGEAVAPLVVQPPGGDSHFNVKYVATGIHRVVYNTANSPPTIHIGTVSCSCPSPLRCVVGPNSQPNCVL